MARGPPRRRRVARAVSMERDRQGACCGVGGTISMVPIARPLLPSAEAIRPYLERIDKTRIYSNFGPLARELEARLAGHFGLSSDCAVSAANATLALTSALAAMT